MKIVLIRKVKTPLALPVLLQKLLYPMICRLKLFPRHIIFIPKNDTDLGKDFR